LPLARTGVDRATKVDEILAAAERRLLEGGYAAMSVAGVARDLGVAQNSIYWYFPSKDHVLVAVLRRILGDVASKKPPKGRGLVHQVLWVTDQMHDLAPLRADLYERAAHSAVAAEFESELDALIRRLLIHGIEPHLPATEVDVAATAFLAMVEGTFRLSLGQAERHRVIRYGLDRITGIT
jgi:TetR/AcrR family transcriptional regulator, cholesterol catabolism regulator